MFSVRTRLHNLSLPLLQASWAIYIFIYMYFVGVFFFFPPTQSCFLSVSSAILAISKTDDVITENGFLLAHSSSPMIARGLLCSNQGCFSSYRPAACFARLLHRCLADDDY